MQEVCQLCLGFSVGNIVQEFCTISLKPNNQHAFSKEEGFRSLEMEQFQTRPLQKKKTKIEREPFRMWEIHLVGNQASIYIKKKESENLWGI